jgi:hypothetical protein
LSQSEARKILGPSLLRGRYFRANASHGRYQRGRLILATNQYPQALIFEVCDVGLVGDLKEIIPPLMKAIQNYKSGMMTKIINKKNNFSITKIMKKNNT